MVIANPTSDSVFKWLLENPRIARFLIETILGETVTEVELKPQEKKYVSEGKLLDERTIAEALATVMLDFVATIKMADGSYKKVLIEIQNARNATDIMRFRNYLAQHYSRKDEIVIDGIQHLVPLPIVTIYFFGFKMKDIAQPVIKIARQYMDRETQEEINTIDEFIERLTHDCYIVQIPRISGKMQSRLDALLSFFEQDHFIDDTRLYKEYLLPLENQSEEIRLIAEQLHFAGTNPERREKLALEQEGYRILAVNMEAKDKIIQEERQAKEEERRAKEEAQRALEESYREIQLLKKLLSDQK